MRFSDEELLFLIDTMKLCWSDASQGIKRKLLIELEKRTAKVAEERCELISRKFLNGFISTVDAERLEALNVRIDLLCPCVSKEQWQSLVEMQMQAEEICKEVAKIAKRLK